MWESISIVLYSDMLTGGKSKDLVSGCQKILEGFFEMVLHTILKILKMSDKQ